MERRIFEHGKVKAIANRDDDTVEVKLVNESRDSEPGFSFSSLRELHQAIAVLEASSSFLKEMERRQIADAIDSSIMSKDPNVPNA